MEKIIFDNSQKSPNAIAIEEGDSHLTYAELFAESASLAQTLKSKGEIGLEEPIALFLGPGLKQVVSQLAVLLIGGTCVPIEPSLPDLRVKDMLQDVGVKYVLTEERETLNVPNLIHTYYEGPTGSAFTQISAWEFISDADRSHILFTSGSSGKPKPVQITSSNIIHLATRTPVTPLLVTDRVSSFNNPGFDLSLFEIWVTLISGATILSIPRSVATDPHVLPKFLKDKRVSVLIITASLFEIVSFACSSAFSTLRHVLTAGDVANVKAMKRVLQAGPPAQLWNTYGPTECTTLTTMFEVTLEETENQKISIGRPVGDMEIFLLDENLLPISGHGRPGEIYITGPQQSPGYLNQSIENDKRFIITSRSNVDNGDNRKELKLYRTGDLAEWRPDLDVLDFCGRADTQVKHGGFRVELREIEHCFLQHENVQSVVVVQQPPLSSGGTHALIAFVVKEYGTEQDIGSLTDYAREYLPRYMVPSHIKDLPELPLTPNGKVDRESVLGRWIKTLREKEKLPDESRKPEESFSVLKGFWKDLLNVPDVGDDADFFALGGTSIQAAALIAWIQERFGCQVSMEELYRFSRLTDLERLIDISQSPSLVNAPDDTSIWMKDVSLVDDIELVPNWEAENEGRVLVTGATGFVGSHLVSDLMMRPSVKRIACIVRPLENQSTVSRFQQAFKKYDLVWPGTQHFRNKLLILEGDLTDDTLGLGPAKFSWLADWTSVIFHLGAKVNFCESYREHHAPNVRGTRNILRLAATGRRKQFHYVSSVDAWGPTGCILGTRELFEDGPLQPHIQGLRYDLGYAQSQWTAEAMVRCMRDRGLPITIFRPGFIIGHSKTGASNPNDFLTRLIVGCIQMGTWPKLTQCLEYAPVDYVVSAMIHIASSVQNLGRSYSLLPPNPRESVTVEGTCKVINEAGYPLEIIDYEEWARNVISKQRDDAPLAPLLPMVQERVLGRLTRWEASQYTPWYRSDNTVEALKGRPDIECFLLDAPMLKRYIASWNRKGFYSL